MEQAIELFSFVCNRIYIKKTLHPTKRFNKLLLYSIGLSRLENLCLYFTDGVCVCVRMSAYVSVCDSYTALCESWRSAGALTHPGRGGCRAPTRLHEGGPRWLQRKTNSRPQLPSPHPSLPPPPPPPPRGPLPHQGSGPRALLSAAWGSSSGAAGAAALCSSAPPLPR